MAWTGTHAPRAGWIGLPMLLVAACTVGTNMPRSRDSGIDPPDAALNDAAHDDAAVTPDAGPEVPPPSFRVDLRVRGTGFDEHVGRQVIFGLVEQTDAGEQLLARRARVVASDGTFSLDWPSAFERGASYRVLAFVDAPSGEWIEKRTCGATQGDLPWNILERAVDGDVSLDVTPPTSIDPSACDHYSPASDFDRDGCISDAEADIALRVIGIDLELGDGAAQDIDFDRRGTSADSNEFFGQYFGGLACD